MLSAGGFMEVAASLNLYRFNRIGSLHSVALGFEPKSSYYKYDALPIKLYDTGGLASTRMKIIGL